MVEQQPTRKLKARRKRTAGDLYGSGFSKPLLVVKGFSCGSQSEGRAYGWTHGESRVGRKKNHQDVGRVLRFGIGISMKAPIISPN